MQLLLPPCDIAFRLANKLIKTTSGEATHAKWISGCDAESCHRSAKLAIQCLRLTAIKVPLQLDSPLQVVAELFFESKLVAHQIRIQRERAFEWPDFPAFLNAPNIFEDVCDTPSPAGITVSTPYQSAVLVHQALTLLVAASVVFGLR